MTGDTDYFDFDTMLPTWAVGTTDGNYLTLGAQLPTRDGRWCGNAYVDQIREGHDREALAIVITDAGTEMRLNLQELEWAFYPPRYIMDIMEARKKFAVPGRCDRKNQK